MISHEATFPVSTVQTLCSSKFVIALTVVSKEWTVAVNRLREVVICLVVTASKCVLQSCNSDTTSYL